MYIFSKSVKFKNKILQGEDYLNYEPKSDKEACWSWCKSTKDCNWFSYETNGIQMCSLFENCLEIDEEHYPQYISGHKNCEYIYSMFFQIFLGISV